MKRYYVIYLFVLVIAVFLMRGGEVFAATVYPVIDSSSVRVGDTAVITLFLDTEGETINTVDGSFSLGANTQLLAVKDFSFAGSGFSYWVHHPSLSLESGIISFVGGAPGGVSGSSVVLFKTIVLAKKTGTISITPGAINAYLNDGKGTLISVRTKTLSVTAQKQTGEPNDSWARVLASDTRPPSDLRVEFGKSTELFEGKWFVSIRAADSESGIDRYEVMENGRSVVLATPLYELSNQSGNARLNVVVYDKAGNKSEITISQDKGWPWWYVVVIVVVIVCALYIIRRFIRRKKIIQW